MKDSQRKLLFFLRKEWGIKNVKDVFRLNGRSLVINTAQDTKYILQSFSINKKNVEKIVFLYNYLYQKEMPVYKIVPNLKKEKIVSWMRKIWILKLYIPGKEFKMNSKEHIKNAAILLSYLHRINYDQEIGDIDNYKYISLADPYHWLVNLQNEIIKISNSMDNNIVKKFVYTVEKTVSEININVYENQPCAIVHGDFHGRNIIYKGEEISGLIDMDTIGISARIIDVTEAMILLGRKSHGSFEFNYSLISVFLKNYLERIKLTNEERKYAKMIIKLRFAPRVEFLDYLFGCNCQKKTNQLLWSMQAISAIDECFDNSILKEFGF